jgi:ABC-type lipoprotein release transport system permease subunit
MAGVAVGLAGGLYFSMFVETLLFEIEPLSLWSIALPLVSLLVVAIASTWLPLRRAIHVDPTEALRVE